MLHKLLLGLVALLCVINMASAKTYNLQIKGDHGLLAAVMQKPDGLPSYPIVMLMHGFTSHNEMPLLKQIADNL